MTKGLDCKNEDTRGPKSPNCDTKWTKIAQLKPRRPKSYNHDSWGTKSAIKPFYLISSCRVNVEINPLWAKPTMPGAGPTEPQNLVWVRLISYSMWSLGPHSWHPHLPITVVSSHLRRPYQGTHQHAIGQEDYPVVLKAHNPHMLSLGGTMPQV